MRTTLLALTMLVCAGTTLANPSVVSVTFQEPENFTDIRPTNETRSRYEQRVTVAFTSMFETLATRLPEGYQWNVTIADIDLAGDVDYFAAGTGQPIRIIRDVHSPAIRFVQSLRDPHGEEIASGEIRLRDMGFMQRPSRVGNRPEFEHERVMLTDWFNKTITPIVDHHVASAPKVSQPPR